MVWQIFAFWEAIPAKTFIFNLTQTATGTVFADKVCIFGLTHFASWKRILGQVFNISWTRGQPICNLIRIRWETAIFLRESFLLTNNNRYFKWPKYWLQHQLPVKFGSSGFRWASFRSGCFSAWQEIARSPPLRVASYVVANISVVTWNIFGLWQFFNFYRFLGISLFDRFLQFDKFLEILVRSTW